jgi:hypothetical protein
VRQAKSDRQPKRIRTASVLNPVMNARRNRLNNPDVAAYGFDDFVKVAMQRLLGEAE